MILLDSRSLNSFLSGTCAASGSFFGKLAGIDFFKGNLFILRVICFCLMLIFNSIGVTYFAKSLHSSTSSLHATVATVSTNYLVSGLLGVLFFQEETPFLWWCGIGLILSGLILVSK